MMTSDDKVGGWVKKRQNHDDVILECPLTETWCTIRNFEFSEDFFPSGDQVKLTQSFDLRLFIAV